ncbi:MAG: hypothetical protein GY782_06430 [Gammaproteobacteria bacterium]|nr:hypothetical protein [Gammaproteobacteria bacterium]
MADPYQNVFGQPFNPIPDARFQGVAVMAQQAAEAAGQYVEQAVMENPVAAAKIVGTAAVYGATSAAVTATSMVKQGVSKLTQLGKRSAPDMEPMAPNKKRLTSVAKNPPSTQAPTTKARPQETSSSTNMSSNHVQNGDDIPVMPFGRLAKTAPDYFTIKLPYATIINFVSSSGENGTNPNATSLMRQFRLNSIFDVDVQGPGNQQPQGRDLWSQVYQYYRVTRSDFKITYMNNNTQTDRDARLLVGYQWAEEDAASSQFSTGRIAKLVSKRSRQTPLLGKNCDQGGNAVVLQYSYDEASFDHHINENTKNTIWTGIGTSPDLKRTLQVDIHNMQDQAGKIDATIIVEVEYTVQFREAANSTIKGGVDDD